MIHSKSLLAPNPAPQRRVLEDSRLFRWMQQNCTSFSCLWFMIHDNGVQIDRFTGHKSRCSWSHPVHDLMAHISELLNWCHQFYSKDVKELKHKFDRYFTTLQSGVHYTKPKKHSSYSDTVEYSTDIFKLDWQQTYFTHTFAIFKDITSMMNTQKLSFLWLCEISNAS